MFLALDEITVGRRGVRTGRETIVVFGDLLGVLPCGRRARVIVEGKKKQSSRRRKKLRCHQQRPVTAELDIPDSTLAGPGPEA
jgi:hypothetical protein